MCGIAGFIEASASTPFHELEARGQAMTKAMHLRGPDDNGVWCDAEAGVVLTQARLSIIDLSPAGHQPMVSHCGRYVITYNGEAYNSEELKRELPGIEWRGHSDTEVIVEACARWGVEATVERLIGMFAFALWDRQDRSLTLVRDRFGIKPLYWGWQKKTFLFGSELKALMTHGDFSRSINRNALASYMRFNYVPAPHSIFEGIEKLKPGHILTLKAEGTTTQFCYWDLHAKASEAQRNPLDISDAEAEDQLDNLVRDAVRRRMVADVPVGAFLSGGIDSSTVVAAMQAESGAPVHSYSIGMQESGYNEAEHAKAVAKHLGTHHTELYVSPEDAQREIPNLAQWYDEPFADSSQIPTYLVSRLARQSVTVSLSGDGGDELFSGYNRYMWGDKLWRNASPWPAFVRKGTACMIRGLSPAAWDKIGKLIPAGSRPQLLGIKAHKVAAALGAKDGNELYRRLVSIWHNPNSVVPGSSEPQDLLWDESIQSDIPQLMERMQMFDGLTYLPNDILTKVDRASMAVSLEARVPLLDHRIAEFAMQLPRHMRVRNGEGKWLLRNVLSRYVPRELFERPKMGFGIPIGQWLRGPLRDWAEDLLDPVKLEQDDMLNAVPIRSVWQQHLSGASNNEVQMWTVLMFQAWRQRWSSQ
ncbi:MAG: asparagine synthase (glutamine-hydrolyzing) [Rhodospirillales bacterium]|nr:asparagine synthase (glutamine-hydrolyzing) [Rhodospirillales bacterium]